MNFTNFAVGGAMTGRIREDTVERCACDMGSPMDTSEDMPVTQGRRRRVDDLRLAFVVKKEVAKEHEKWGGPGMNAQWDPARASPFDGADAASCLGDRSV